MHKEGSCTHLQSGDATFRALHRVVTAGCNSGLSGAYYVQRGNLCFDVGGVGPGAVVVAAAGLASDALPASPRARARRPARAAAPRVRRYALAIGSTRAALRSARCAAARVEQIGSLSQLSHASKLARTHAAISAASHRTSTSHVTPMKTNHETQPSVSAHPPYWSVAVHPPRLVIAAFDGEFLSQKHVTTCSSSYFFKNFCAFDFVL